MKKLPKICKSRLGLDQILVWKFIQNMLQHHDIIIKPAMCENLDPHVTVFYVCLQHDKILCNIVYYE